MPAERDAVKERSRERGRGVRGALERERSVGGASEEHERSIRGAFMERGRSVGTGESLEERWRSVLGWMRKKHPGNV